MVINNKKSLASQQELEFIIDPKDGDNAIPSAHVRGWRHFTRIINNGKLHVNNDELIFRGQRNASWGLVPTIARLSGTDFYEEGLAKKHLEKFKYSIRGRTKIYLTDADDNDVNLWALGQHYGLYTPLLDWSRSPFVALFFAMSEPNPEKEIPKNPSRVVFCLNKSKLKKYDELDKIFVDPLGGEHERLISQDGLFTFSPSGKTNLELEILNSIKGKFIWDDSKFDTPNEMKDFIFKIHIPMISEAERLKCMRALRRMNLHFASLFPDIHGSSQHCNALMLDMLQQQK